MHSSCCRRCRVVLRRCHSRQSVSDRHWYGSPTQIRRPGDRKPIFLPPLYLGSSCPRLPPGLAGHHAQQGHQLTDRNAELPPSPVPLSTRLRPPAFCSLSVWPPALPWHWWRGRGSCPEATNPDRGRQPPHRPAFSALSVESRTLSAHASSSSDPVSVNRQN